MNDSQIKDIIKKSVSAAVVYCGSQSALARNAKITQGAIGKYLRGDAKPTGLTARRLSIAVDKTLMPVDFAPHIFGEEDLDSVA
jgi:transcriptional regulator with XRE-family HTH domain